MRKLNVGVIGVGVFGENHARIYAESDKTNLIGVADLNEKRAETIAKKYSAKFSFTDYNRLLERDIDAVSIVLPDFAHKKPCIEAAKAGKHILVEKPLATNSEDAQEIIAAVKENDVRLMVDFSNRWNPPFVQAKNMIEKDELGEILHINIRLNDTIWVPTEMLSWSDKSSVLWFLGSHSFDLCRWLLQSEVKNIKSITSKKLLKREFAIDTQDFYLSTLQFQNGTIVQMENNWVLPKAAPTVFEFNAKIIGTKGMLKIDTSHNRCLEKYTNKEHVYPDLLCITEGRKKLRGFNVDSINHFVECLIKEEEFDVLLDEGLIVTEVLEKIEKEAILVE